MSQPQILVVDDQDYFSAFLKEKLEELGYVVSTAADAAEALEHVICSSTPLVILLDLILPKVSGEDLLQELSRSARASAIRVVLVSARHTVSTIAPTNPLVVGRVQKPIDLGELVQMVAIAAGELT